MADLLDDVHVHRLEPNYLMGPDWRKVLQRLLNQAHAELTAIVAKRSGRLAESIESSIEVGGLRYDRLIGRLTIGEGLIYGAAHEFGTDRSEGTRLSDRRHWVHGHQAAADDLEQVLASLHV